MTERPLWVRWLVTLGVAFTLLVPAGVAAGCSGSGSGGSSAKGGDCDPNQVKSKVGRKICGLPPLPDEKDKAPAKTDCSIFKKQSSRDWCLSMNGYNGSGAGKDPGDVSKVRGVKCYEGYSKSQCNNMALGKAMNAQVFGDGEWSALRTLWQHESDWDEHNQGSETELGRAYGIPQALPASKLANAGPDWRDNPKTQIKWGLGYIKSRYGTPSNAWSKWQSRNPHWY